MLIQTESKGTVCVNDYKITKTLTITINPQSTCETPNNFNTLGAHTQF